MKNKISNYKLYVAFPICVTKIETEKWEKYETFGRVENKVIISPKKVLIYSANKDGLNGFFNYKTNERVFEKSYECSFETHALEGPYRTYDNEYGFGYFIPLNEYIEEKFGFDVSSLPPSIIGKLMHLINIGSWKKIELSMNKDIARLQLEQIGYHKQTKDKDNVKKY